MTWRFAYPANWVVMTVSKPKTIFWPGYHLPESDTFEIPLGGQVTVTALGLQAGDEISFELVFTPAVQPDLCSCPPGIVDLPSVAASTVLKLGGEIIKLNADHPYVVLDAPQGMRVRGVLSAADHSGIWVWATNTSTANVSDTQRGLD